MNNPTIPKEVIDRIEDDASDCCANRPTISPWGAYRAGASHEYILAQQELEVSRGMLDEAKSEIQGLMERIEMMKKQEKKDRLSFAWKALDEVYKAIQFAGPEFEPVARDSFHFQMNFIAEQLKKLGNDH